MYVREADERGITRTDWLDSRHTFSFNQYYDARHLGWSDLRVINEDRVRPGQGFPTHGHRDMEILSWVLEGELAHHDSTGSEGVLRPGELQHMSAGSGVTHSEFNASATAPLHFLQIWLLPARAGLAPGYEQRAFADASLRDAWCPVATPDGRAGTLRLQQDASLSIARLDVGHAVEWHVPHGRRAWLQVARGTVRLPAAALALEAGDGLACDAGEVLALQATSAAELLLFDLRGAAA